MHSPDRTVPLLVLSQVLGGVGVGAGIAANSLLTEQVSGSETWSGLGQSAIVIGSALLAVPLARRAVRVGRGPALAAGYLLGALGAGLVVLAAVAGALWLLLLGAVLMGGGTAAGLQARYAATDVSDAGSRGRNLSLVVWATTVGAVSGPNLTGPGSRVGDVLGVPPLAGMYVLAAAMFALAAVVVSGVGRVRPVRADSTSMAAPATPPVSLSTAQVLREIWVRPLARLALLAIVGAHAVMVGVMVMTPVHLGHQGATLRIVGLVISLHIAGMYAAAPVFGWLSDRLGRLGVLAVGLLLLVASLTSVATSGAATHDGLPPQVTAGLMLLGLGWSACTIAGATLLTESMPVPLRIRAQGTSDLAMGTVAALAGLLSGPVLALVGYGWLAVSAGALLLPLAASLVGARVVRRASAPTPV